MLKLKAAMFAPYPYWMLLVAIGAGPAILAASISRDLLMPAGIVTMVLQIFIFGRILSHVQPDRTTTFWGILREYGVYYLIAVILIGVVAFAFGLAISRVMSPHLPNALTLGVTKGLVAAITIYVWPLVFLKRSSVEAILAGALVLMRQLVSSLWIVGIVLIGQLVQSVGLMVYLDHRSGWGFAVLLLAGVVYIYLVAVSFAAALHQLLGVRVVGAAAEA